MTRTIRRISQGVFLGLFLYLIINTVYPLGTRIPVDLFTRIDPLVAGASMLAARAFIPKAIYSLIIVGITLLLGRVFCGWVCPLGTTLDVSDRLFFRRKPRRTDIRLPGLKFYILTGLFITALFSMQAVYLLDPLSLLTRTVVLVFIAPIQMILRALSDVLMNASSSDWMPLASASLWLGDRLAGLEMVTASQVYYRQAFVVLAVFVGIIGLNSLAQRFWCSSLCPLGALLGLISRIPILKRAVGSGCNDCTRCARECKTGAIPENPRLTKYAECIECFNCVQTCPRDTVSFRLRPRPEVQPETRLNLSRRRVLQGAGVGLAFAAMAKIDPSRKRGAQSPNTKTSSPALIRPPGSVREDEFVNRCVRCGACMKVCPTNGLQPALHEAGIEGFWTPILVPRIGPCIQECNGCGDVCPTEAIRPFEIKEKEKIFIGTAVIERDRCLAWYADKTCLVCDEYCSYHAVTWKKVDGYKRPFVDEAKCVGCGACETACPIQPLAAIRIFSLGDKREG